MPLKNHHSSAPPRWILKDLMGRPDQELTGLTQAIHRRLRRLERLRPHLTPKVSPRYFLEAFHLKESISQLMAKLRAAAFLRVAEDTTNQKARAFEARVRERLSLFHNRLLFLDLWWQQLDDRPASQLLRRAGDLRYHLESLRRLTPYTLSEAEERLIAIKNCTGRDALESLYALITNGLTFASPVKRGPRSLTREELMTYVRSPLPAVRETAYQELFRVYSSHRDVLGDLYKSLVLDWKHEGKTLRHYPTPIAVRNVSNDVPDQSVEALLSVCRKHAPVFQEYFRIKAKLLGLRSMSREHIYAPLGTTGRRYGFDQAFSLVMQAYRRFSPTLADLALQVLQARHLDAQIRPGKMGGAFCYSVLPGSTPYVLMNFNGQPRDLSTLAHELGHAVHSLLAKDHSVLTFHPSLPLAETASVFGEQLLTDALLKDNHRKKARQALLVNQLDDLYATIMRQAYFVEFERLAHQMIDEGRTIDDLGEAYWRLLNRQFGKAISVPKEFRWEWLAIPHLFASPFYCYAYAFGNLLVLSLFQQYAKQGQGFIPAYLALLSSGGSASPETLLQPIGINIRSEAFWQSGFRRIQLMINDLERTLS